MIVYGGVGANDKYLNDIWEFSFVFKRWRHCTISLAPDIDDDFGIAYHTLTFVHDWIRLYNGLTGKLEMLINPPF